MSMMRNVTVNRTTKETDITLSINLDGSGSVEVSTGIGFFDHMLTAFAVHGGFDLRLAVKGDLEVDCHHTIEDVGIVLGQAFSQILADKSSICRYGTFYIPMDEALAQCSLDISGRAYLVFHAEFSNEMVGTFETAMAEEFFRAFASNAGVTLHLNVLYGKNDHHKLEAIFKAFGHALSQGSALKKDGTVLSTKGVLA